MKIEHQVTGRYKIEAVNSETGERRLLVDWFDNMITDIGLERMGNGSFVGRCHVGSGSAAPAATDTGLQSPVAETSTILGSLLTGASASAPYYGWARITFRFAPGVAVGNLSEVAMTWAPGNSSAFSRALIKEAGSPVTITVLAQDYLDVTYEFRSYAPTADITFQTVVAGITHNCVAKACRATNAFYWTPAIFQAVAINGTTVYSGDVGDVTTTPSGTAGGGTLTNNAYSANSKQRSASLDWGLTSGNFAGGIKSVIVGTSIGEFQCSFTPTIAKPTDNTKSLRLNAYVSWARKTLP